MRYLINLFGATTGTSSVTVQKSGKLKQVIMGLQQITDADNDAIVICASFDGVNPSLSTSNIASQTRVLGILASHSAITGAAGADKNGQSVVIPCNENVGQGDNIYLHTDRTGTATALAWAIFVVE